MDKDISHNPHQHAQQSVDIDVPDVQGRHNANMFNMAGGGSSSDDKKREKSRGEKQFNFLTYYGVGYILNAAISIASVFWVERTPGGRKFLTAAAEKIAGEGADTIKKDNIRNIVSKTFLLVGGWAVMVPMKLMEDRKEKIVKSLDKMYYGENAESDPVVKKSHDAIAREPEQTWVSILGSRTIAMIPFYMAIGLFWRNTSWLAQKTNPELAKYAADPEGWKALSLGGKAKQLIGQATGFVTPEGIKKLSEENPEKMAELTDKSFFLDKVGIWLGRAIGFLTALVKGDMKELERVTRFAKESPAEIVEGTVYKIGEDGKNLLDEAGKPIKNTDKDTHATHLGYTFFSEMVLSYIVATSIFILTRVTAPFLGKKKEGVDAAPATPENEAKSEVAIANKLAAETPKKSAPGLNGDKPRNTIALEGISHTQPSALEMGPQHS